MTTLAEIKKKYEQSSSFQKEMKKAEDNYQILHQRAYYSNISDAETFFMEKFAGKTRMDIDIHFIYATYQHIKASTLDKLTLNFIAKLPKSLISYLGPLDFICSSILMTNSSQMLFLISKLSCKYYPSNII